MSVDELKNCMMQSERSEKRFHCSEKYELDLSAATMPGTLARNAA